MPHLHFTDNRCILRCQSKNQDYFTIKNNTDNFRNLSIQPIGNLTLIPFEQANIHTSKCRNDLNDEQFSSILGTLCPLEQVKPTNKKELTKIFKETGLSGLGQHILDNSGKFKLTHFSSLSINIYVPLNAEHCHFDVDNKEYNKLPRKFRKTLGEKCLEDKKTS